jgi:hypothetical protein
MAELDPHVAARLRRIASARGWTEDEALAQAVARGAAALEAESATDLADDEADVLKAAIAALEQIPTDTFAAIGRTEPSG